MTDVLIAGAGIAGLALLRELHRSGIPAVALERRREPDDGGLAINLPGNAVAALRRLGLGDGLRRHGRPVARRDYRTDKGRLLFTVDEAAFWGPDLTPHCLRRGDLASLLAGGMPRDLIRWDAAVTAVSRTGPGVAVDTGTGERHSARLLVGADGVRSAVRRLCFGDAAPAAARLASASWRFMAPNPGVDCWTVWAGAEAMVLLIPVDGGEVYGWAAATGKHGGAEDPTILRELTRPFPAPVRDAVEAAVAKGRMHGSPLDEVRLARWCDDRVVLIGDAAHATAPVWAQGAALGLEDASVLAGLLRGSGPWDAALRRYEQLRRPRVDHVQSMTDRMSKAARLPTWLRNLLMPVVGPRSYRGTYEPLKAETGQV